MRIEGLEWNVIQYLTDNTALDMPVCVDGLDPENSRDQISFTLSGGTKQNDAYAIASPELQVLVRSKSSTKAKKQVFKIFNLLDNKFGLELPEYSDGTYQYEAVTVPQISSVQIPSYIGADNNFAHMWVVNFNLTGVLDH